MCKTQTMGFRFCRNPSLAEHHQRPIPWWCRYTTYDDYIPDVFFPGRDLSDVTTIFFQSKSVHDKRQRQMQVINDPWPPMSTTRFRILFFTLLIFHFTSHTVAAHKIGVIPDCTETGVVIFGPAFSSIDTLCHLSAHSPLPCVQLNIRSRRRRLGHLAVRSMFSAIL